MSYKVNVHFENVISTQLISSRISEFCSKTRKSAISFPSLLVVLGQPNYCDKNFATHKKKTRRVKRVQVHPHYRGKPDGIKKPTKKQMPRFDFALIEVQKEMFNYHQNFNFKFEPTVRPICLPNRQMWKTKFFNQSSTVSGYGRNEAIKIHGKHQTASRLMQANLRIIGRKDKKCSKVKFTYLFTNKRTLLI